MRTIVIGLGNPVRADDAVGPAVARAVGQRLRGAADVDVTEVWAGGLHLVEAMLGYDRAVVIDAMTTGRAAPGTLRRLALADLDDTRNTTCVHDTSLPLALELWRRLGAAVPREVSVWGIEAADTDSFSEELSEPVARAVPAAVDAIANALQVSGGAEA